MARKYTKEQIRKAALGLQNPHTPEKKETDYAKTLAWLRWHKKKK